jgi:serine/threonine protein kinase
MDYAFQQKINKSNYNVLYPIGKGGFGKVWKVDCKRTKTVLAMKEMYKAKIIQKKSINSVMNERTLLAKVNHPFLINMNSAFQDRENLYLLMDYLDGGDLRYHIGKKRRFTENETKFLVANMVVGLEYLHRNKIIHRDMKPENLVFDSDGYLRITDLGISRAWREENYQDTSGTPGYMAPEVICRKNHAYGVDFFAVGVMAYEMMMGRRPYLGRNRKEIRDQILSKQASVKK